MPTNEQLQALLDDYVTGNISTADKQLLLTWLNDPVIARQAEALLHRELEVGTYEADQLPEIHSRLHARLHTVMASSQTEAAIPPPSLLRRLTQNKVWWAAAAVVLVLLGASMYRMLQRSSTLPIVAIAEKDVPPGTNRATLTLANGSVVTLDSAGNQVIQQGAATVHQQGGQLRYETQVGAASDDYNTLTTPRGGQFQVILPDGTKVWLNAASSIKYPVAFAGDERRVTINGEVYFEVAHNKEKPFRVVSDEQIIEVLGTHFNVNAYDDEEAVRTTLLEGKVKATIANGQWSVLKPGQQAVIHDSQLTIHDDIDLDQVMAWKNGAFSFENRSLQEVMRQLARWYDIEVVYEGKPPSVTFIGEMGRDVHLSKVIAFLRESRIQCRLEKDGKRLVVTN